VAEGDEEQAESSDSENDKTMKKARETQQAQG
jgi:hypothetical protein